jgi:hypothetical protein
MLFLMNCVVRISMTKKPYYATAPRNAPRNRITINETKHLEFILQGRTTEYRTPVFSVATH